MHSKFCDSYESLWRYSPLLKPRISFRVQAISKMLCDPKVRFLPAVLIYINLDIM